MSTELTSENIKQLDNEGRNYSPWAIRCRLVLLGLDLWDIVNPAVETSNRPTPRPSSPSSSRKPPTASASATDPVAEWDRKNARALCYISLPVDDTPLRAIYGKDTAKEAWQASADRYIDVGVQDAFILSSRLHRFVLDDSKPLVPQIIEMCEMRSRLATLDDEMTDAKFAMVLSEVLASFVRNP